ncbi:MAG: hypothetical protein ACLU8F_02685 [Clostridia bacterium]
MKSVYRSFKKFAEAYGLTNIDSDYLERLDFFYYNHIGPMYIMVDEDFKEFLLENSYDVLLAAWLYNLLFKLQEAIVKQKEIHTTFCFTTIQPISYPEIYAGQFLDEYNSAFLKESSRE